MRRLAILFLAVGAGLSVMNVAHASSDTGAPETTRESGAEQLSPVDVLQVSGLVDAIVLAEIEDAITRAEGDESQALILQMNSRASLVGRDDMKRLYERIESASVPVAIWVGPSG